MIVTDPDNAFFKKFLSPYYVVTQDGQYLFGTTQKGRRPDRVFYMVPNSYKLGVGQRSFDCETGKQVFSIIDSYRATMDKIVQHGVQGEHEFSTGIEVEVSIQNPHSAYIAWMGRLMVFPPKKIPTSCYNYIIPERLPASIIEQIKEVWPSFDEKTPLTLFDFCEMNDDIRRVLNLNIDYFGGAYKKPNLTMVWHRAEHANLVSYHAGCCNGRVLKGLSGTGKTTLTVGENIYQDDALVGVPVYENGKVKKMHIIGLEAASFAKSEGLTETSPEWEGLMKSRDGRVVLCMNIDCENVTYALKTIKGYDVVVPVAEGKPGQLACTEYSKSGTTNGRFIFKFSDLNDEWGAPQYLKAEGLSFRRFDILEPIIRIVEPTMAAALDSGCESIITSAVDGVTANSRTRVYAATDFMAREQAEQALLKKRIYEELGVGLNESLIFFVVNTGFVGEQAVDDISTGKGEKISVTDTKRLIYLVENDMIDNWLCHPVFGYLIPDPKELEEVHKMEGFSWRFNPLRFYSSEDIIALIKRDIQERTTYLKRLFSGQQQEDMINDVINVWENCRLCSPDDITSFYETYYCVL